jgi:hypothetical protein
MTHNKYEVTNSENLIADTAAAGSLALASETLHASVVQEHLPGVEGVAKEALPAFDNRATLVVDAEVEGPWHYSASAIDTFTRERSEEATGKFGTGTYFGVGDLSGETVDGLKAGDSVKHEIGFKGNVLVVDRKNVVGLSRHIDELQGRRISRLRTTVQTSPITDRLRGTAIDGHAVSAVMVYMDPERTSGELVVLPEGIEGVEVVK